MLSVALWDFLDSKQKAVFSYSRKKMMKKKLLSEHHKKEGLIVQVRQEIFNTLDGSLNGRLLPNVRKVFLRNDGQ